MKRWQVWLGLLLGSACIVYIVLTIENPGDFIHALEKIRFFYLVPIIALYFLLMFLRSLRWQFIMNQSGRVSLRNAWNAILICYMGNNIFPLRAGELMRVFLIGKKEPSLTYSAALATVVVERLFDFFATLGCLAVVLLFAPLPEEQIMITLADKQYNLQKTINGLGLGTMFATILLFLFLIVLNARTAWTMTIVRRILAPPLRLLAAAGDSFPRFKPLLSDRPAAGAEKMTGLIQRFASGLLLLGRPRAIFATLGLSALIWLTNLLPVWLSAFAYHVKLDFLQTLLLLIVGAAAASIPGPPGFFGTFHAFNREALFYLMNVDRNTALSIAILIHACYYFPLVAAGLITAWREGYSLAELQHTAQTPPPAG